MSLNFNSDDPNIAILDHRGIVSIGGDDRRIFLQGLISQDIDKINEKQATYGALLTPQGKFLHEFFILELGDKLVLECERDRAADLVTRLSRFKLRAKVTIEDVSDAYRIAVVFTPTAPALAASELGLETVAGAAIRSAMGTTFVDPRHADLGCRLILENDADLPMAQLVKSEDYDFWRLQLGVGDGSRDFDIEKTTLLEANFDALNGVDWDKGCYMGQEITARTHYRGLVKRRLVPVQFDGPTPVRGTQVLTNGTPIGEIRSTAENRGLANMRVDALNAGDLSAGEARLCVATPNWLLPFVEKT